MSKKPELTEAQHALLAEYMDATRNLAAVEQAHDQAKARHAKAQRAWYQSLLAERDAG